MKNVVLSECNSEDNLPVNILIGADQYWNIANEEDKRGESGHVSVNNKYPDTHLYSDTHSVNLAATHVLLIDTHRDERDVCDMELAEKIYTFWELESIGIKQEENSVLETFNKTITFRNQRYEVDLPQKEAHDPLPDNRSLSQRRLQSLLKQLRRKPEQLKEYDRVIKDQLEKGIIERVKHLRKLILIIRYNIFLITAS